MIVTSKFLVKFLSFNLKGAKAVTVFPFIFIREAVLVEDAALINHEKIHIRQQLELLLVFFYIAYTVEFLVRFIQHKDMMTAYTSISFEREAYSNQKDVNFLKGRPVFNFYRYFKIK